MKKVLMLASVASMIDQFNMPNINLLQEIGYEVDVACNFLNGNTCDNKELEELKKKLSDENIKYFQIDFSRNIMNIKENIKSYQEVKKIMIENNYEFVHCHSPIGGVVGRLCGKKTKTKVIYTAHGFHFYKGASLKNWLIFYPVEKICSRYTDALITINREDFELAQKKMNAKKTYYVHGVGIDINKINKVSVNRNQMCDSLGISGDSVLLLSVGELNENKNHQIVIRALAKLNNQNIHYLIAGAGKLEVTLKKLAIDLHIEKQVHFLGFRKDILNLYASSDIFVFPSYREGLSLSLMEAMASGLPVICSRIRGNTDLIDDGMGGFLFSPNDENSLVKKINALLNDDDRLMSMKKYNLNKIQSFNVKLVKSELEGIYKQISKEELKNIYKES